MIAHEAVGSMRRPAWVDFHICLGTRPIFGEFVYRRMGAQVVLSAGDVSYPAGAGTGRWVGEVRGRAARCKIKACLRGLRIGRGRAAWAPSAS